MALEPRKRLFHFDAFSFDPNHLKKQFKTIFARWITQQTTLNLLAGVSALSNWN